MSRVGFECVHCHHRLSVTAEWAGKAVRCPKCQQVVVAPTVSSHGLRPAAPPPPSAPDLSKVTRKVDETDSIFSDPDDGDSLFGGLSEARKPILPPSPADSAQPTVRVPGVPDRTPTSSPSASRTHLDMAAMPTVSGNVVVPTPVEPANPFRRMVDEVMTAETEDEAEEPEPELEPALAARSRGLKWALIVVSVYAALATAAAAWGWMKVLSEKPGAMTPKK